MALRRWASKKGAVGLCARLTVATLVLISLGGPPARADEIPVQSAHPANAFIDSIGINTHIGYLDRSWGDMSLWLPQLKSSGIRHIRDSLNPGSPWTEARFEAVRAATGVDLNYIVPSPIATSPSQVVADAMKMVTGPLSRMVTSVEGVNEWDRNASGGSWDVTLRETQRRLYAAIKGDDRTAHLSVIAPSLTGRESGGILGPVDADFGNMHNYTGGWPETSEHLDDEMALAARVAPGRAAWSTEANGHTAVASPDPHRPMSEEAQGVYAPRQLLEAFRKGVPRTYLYALIDEGVDPLDAEFNFGLLRSDGSAKPAYTAVRNLISILDDAAGTAGSLAYRLDGANDSTRTVLVQKRDGDFYLAVWQEDAVWDPHSLEPLSPAPSSLSLRLSGDARISQYVPNESRSALTAATAATFQFESSAKVTILKIDPAAMNGGGPSEALNLWVASDAGEADPPMEVPPPTADVSPHQSSTARDASPKQEYGHTGDTSRDSSPARPLDGPTGVAEETRVMGGRSIEPHSAGVISASEVRENRGWRSIATAAGLLLCVVVALSTGWRILPVDRCASRWFRRP